MSQPAYRPPEPLPAPLTLDYSMLARRPGARQLVRAVAGNPLLVLSSVVGILLVLVPLGVLVGMTVRAMSGRPLDLGAVAVVVMLLIAGGCVLRDVMRRGRGAGPLERFATVNQLAWIPTGLRRSYAGSEFAAGTHAVLHGVRTRDARWLEVGDRQRVTSPLRRYRRMPQLYLRMRLSGPPDLEPDEPVITPVLDRELRELAGAYRVELSGEELTVFGSRPLEPTREGRVGVALALCGALARRADELLVGGQAPSRPSLEAAGASPGTSPGTDPASTRPDTSTTRSSGAGRVLLVALALLVLGPLAIAIPLSIIDDWGLPALALRVIVIILILGALWGIGLVVRWLLTPRD